MKRRTLIGLLGSVASWPLTIRAQQKPMPMVGFLGVGSPGSFAPHVAAFRKGLSEFGYIEGKTVAVEYRWAEGHDDRLPAMAADLVARRVDVIATSGGPVAALAAKNATVVVPTSSLALRPLSAGLITSLARPGGTPHWN
jgi:putative ABC transport system substrate-binding protein